MPKKSSKNLPTDRKTDYLFDYFMNEDKIDEQLKEELDEQLKEKLENYQPKLDSRVGTDKKEHLFSSETEEEKELPSISPNSSDNKYDADFNDSDNVSEISHSSSRSPYGKKIEAANQFYPTKPMSDRRPKEIMSDKPLLGNKLIDDVERYVETPEERRARAREAYSKLQDLVDKYEVKLTRKYSIDDDPDELEAEYKMHKERRNKTNQVKLYKNILLTIVSGTEFLNDKYNPFEFKLKDWSKQVASDMDDYTEVLEEIYEKYKDKGGKMAPEIRLMFMIILSGVTFHLSQTLFGANGLGAAVQSNPNVLNQLLGGLMKGGGSNILGGGGDDVPQVTELPPDARGLLGAIRKQNQAKKQSEPRSEYATDKLSDRSTSSGPSNSIMNEQLAIEREKRILAEQRADFEMKVRMQNELHANQMNQMNQMKNQIALQPNQIQPTVTITPSQSQPNPSNRGNVILSDVSKGPRFRNNPAVSINPNPIYQNKPADEFNMDMFASEIRDTAPSDTYQNQPKVKGKSTSSLTTGARLSPWRGNSAKKSSKEIFDDILDSLDGSSIDIDDVIETSTRKNRNVKPIKPVTSTRKPRNTSATKKRGSDALSDFLSTSKRNSNVIKL